MNKMNKNFVWTGFFFLLLLSFASASTYNGEGTYEVRQGDFITITDSSVSILSIDLDPRDDSGYQYTNQPRIYISGGGAGYVLHEGESSNVLVNRVSDRYVMTITAKDIDVNSGTASIYVEEYVYDYDPSATNPDTSKDKYTQYGPFNNLRTVQIGDDIFGFVYSNDKKNYNVKMNDKEYGPYDTVKSFSIAKDSFGFIYNFNSENYVRINENTYGPFKRVMGLSLSEDNWAFAYENASGSKFLQTKDSLLGHYDYLWSQISLSGDTLGYTYGKDGEYHVIVDGEDVGDGSGGVEISKSGRYAYCYFENSKGYCNVNGKVYGPYGTGLEAIISDEHFIISYQDKLEDGGKYYKIVDDKKYGPYDYSYHSKVSDDLFAFSYDLNDNSYININGKVYGPYEVSGALTNLIIEEDNYAYSYRDSSEWITIVNGDILNCPYGEQVSSIDFHDDDIIFSCSEGSSSYVFIPSSKITLDDEYEQKEIGDSHQNNEKNNEVSEEVLNQCNGCLSKNKCYPLGHRKDGKFCNDLGEFAFQLESKHSCENNFECNSNICISRECVSNSLIQKIINWFRNLFG